VRGAFDSTPVLIAYKEGASDPYRLRLNAIMNDIEKYLPLFENFKPFSGYVPKGYLVDFLGCLTDARFRAMWDIDPSKEGGVEVSTERPTVAWGEGFFEAIDWFEMAREARGTCTMITLGACYGAQAVGAYRALQHLNPMPAKLVAVEPDPENFVWLQKHFRDNGIDPDQHWLLHAALSNSNRPVLFPVGSPGSGAQNCVATNNRPARMEFARAIMESPDLNQRVHNLIVDGDTGIEVNLVPGWNFPARIQILSAVTLADVLRPFDLVDYLESDIQQSEHLVFPPAMDVIQGKVRRVHIGTHGKKVHEALLQDFATRQFEIVFNYEPNSHHDTALGPLEINDGIITARNLRLA
jgi:hypothetical protein